MRMCVFASASLYWNGTYWDVFNFNSKWIHTMWRSYYSCTPVSVLSLLHFTGWRFAFVLIGLAIFHHHHRKNAIILLFPSVSRGFYFTFSSGLSWRNPTYKTSTTLIMNVFISSHHFRSSLKIYPFGFLSSINFSPKLCYAGAGGGAATAIYLKC